VGLPQPLAFRAPRRRLAMLSLGVGWAAWMPSVRGDANVSMHEIDIVWRLGLALLLSSAIGVECEMRQKTAGLRTYTLVGVGSAVFMLVSTFGFADVVARPHVMLAPSRVAAHIVSGIGFIGGGITRGMRLLTCGSSTSTGTGSCAKLSRNAHDGGSRSPISRSSTMEYWKPMDIRLPW
jgi:hypothetical protein